ncbi:MAG: FixH family protein [Chloroflexi bacterium]|nr:FixH family protein [Chloroflexota bacterium]
MAFFRLMVAGLLLIVAAGCRGQAVTPTPAENLSVEMAVEPDPARVGEAALVVTITDAGGQPVDGAKIGARGDMSHAGMAPVLAEVEGGQDGRYRIPFEWTMGGDWFVELTITLPDGTTTSRRFDLSVSGEGASMDMNMGMATAEATP